MRRFFRDDNGGTAVFFALSLIPVGGAVGLSIDTARAYTAHTHLQAAVDAAALAGAIAYNQTTNTASATSNAQSTFDVSVAMKIPGATSTITFDATARKLSISAAYDAPTTFMKIVAAGPATTTVHASADSVVQGGGLSKNLEVSVMLDVTGSMGQNSGTAGVTKLQAMQTAAKNVVDTVVQTTQTPFSSRVALAPFSAAVNVGGYFQTVTGGAPVSGWTSVVERAGAFNATNDPPSSALFPSERIVHTSARSPLWYIANYEKARTTNTPVGATVVALSSDVAGLKSSIDAYSADGTTAGQIGTAWAWYLLSPSWSSVWTGASTPAPFSSSVSKVAILMSDFDYNVYYQGSVGDMNVQAMAVCTAMKNSGVTVYTIGFQVDHTKPASVNLFTNCASDPSKAIEATDGATLISTFDVVATTVLASVSSAVRLAR